MVWPIRYGLSESLVGVHARWSYPFVPLVPRGTLRPLTMAFTSLPVVASWG
jgi:hypothetical protein